MAPITLDWLHVVALLGAIQGVFLAGALATKRRNRTANRLLAATMLAFSIYLASAVYYAAGLLHVYPHFFGVSYPLPFLFGPLVYLYAVTAANRSRPFTRRDLLHLVPFVGTVIAGLPIYMMSGAEKIALFDQLERGELPPMIAITTPLKFVSGVAYTVFTLLFLRRHSDRIKDSYSSLERVNLRWLVWLGAAAAAVWMLAVVIQLLASTGVAVMDAGDDIIALAVAALVYGIGYMGLKQPEIFRYETAEYRVPVELLAAARAPVPVGEAIEPREAMGSASAEPREAEAEATSPRYERSGLSDFEARRLEESLAEVMEQDRPWRDSELTLADLAGRLATTPHKLSEVLNAQVGQTFYDFVNGYRVREVQRRIAAGEARKVTMLALALDAGFASKSTFNLVFKKHTSLTPSAYRQAAGM